MLFDGCLADWCTDARRGVSAPAGFALPDQTLRLLRRIVEERAITRVFEFGTGRSSTLFLDCGCELTSLEDNPRWFNSLTSNGARETRDLHHAMLRRLSFRVDGLAVFRGWRLDTATRERLRAAQLVLIDSPVFAPFRECALLDALRIAPHALVVMDDARDDAVHGFCLRIATANRLPHVYSDLDHGLFFTTRAGQPARRIDGGRGSIETLRTWRRLGRFGGWVVRAATRRDRHESADRSVEGRG